MGIWHLVVLKILSFGGKAKFLVLKSVWPGPRQARLFGLNRIQLNNIASGISSFSSHLLGKRKKCISKNGSGYPNNRCRSPFGVKEKKDEREVVVLIRKRMCGFLQGTWWTGNSKEGKSIFVGQQRWDGKDTGNGNVHGQVRISAETIGVGDLFQMKRVKTFFNHYLSGFQRKGGSVARRNRESWKRFQNSNCYARKESSRKLGEYLMVKSLESLLWTLARGDMLWSFHRIFFSFALQLAARQAERELKEAKTECSNLRQK